MSDRVAEEFATVLQQYQLNKHANSLSPFEFVNHFKSIAASRSLELSDRTESDKFISYDLETKLWHLIDILYQFRHTASESELLPENSYTSDTIKQHNFLTKNKKIREISLIINWLQENSRSVRTDSVNTTGKWQQTQLSISERDFKQSITLPTADDSTAETGLTSMDSDGPIRENSSVLIEDRVADSDNFKLIYKLITSRKIEEAIEVANETGNFTLSLILIGAVHDYIDPVVDQELFKSSEGESEMILDDINTGEPSGQRHKFLWRKTVYKLSQQPNIDHYERLIYNYLCGGDIADNLNEASGDWEEQLLIYLNQLYISKMQNYMDSKLSLTFSFPLPQSDSINEILNILLNNNPELSQHPIRVMCGGVMIEQVQALLHNTIKKLAKEDFTSNVHLNVDDYIMRIVTHLSIFLFLVGGQDSISEKDITMIISSYIKYLSTKKLQEFIPIYLSFIPNETDARECYSLFLSSLTDEEERSKQINIAKNFTDALAITAQANNLSSNSYTTNTETRSLDMPDMDDMDEGKMINVLRRTVERVMVETEDHYKLTGGPLVVIEEGVDDIDFKLYRSVEWFYESKMYEDAITASIVIFRRFLLCGKLSALKQFGQGKNFKQLIKDYDFEVNTKLLSSPSAKAKVSEEMKEELLQYETFIQGLTLIEDWKKFLRDNQINGISSLSGNNRNFWKSQHIHNSIEKVAASLNKLIFNWFKGLINSQERENNTNDVNLFREFRSIYVPYLVIEILQIYQYLRLNDWKYMRSAFQLINLVANEEDNDLLNCFVTSGRLKEFVVRCGEVSSIATEKGIKGIFY